MPHRPLWGWTSIFASFPAATPMTSSIRIFVVAIGITASPAAQSDKGGNGNGLGFGPGGRFAGAGGVGPINALEERSRLVKEMVFNSEAKGMELMAVGAKS